MKSDIRRQSGFSLPTIIALGVVASLWMLGTASLVVPAAAKMTSERTADMARASAEAGLDYALGQLNAPTTRQNSLATAFGQSTIVPMPASVMADYQANPPTGQASTKFTGTLNFQNVAPPSVGAPWSDTYTSYLYDATVDNQNAASALYNNNNSSGNMWRIVTATVSNGVVSRAVRVILKPTLGNTTKMEAVPGTPIPIFAFSFFGIGNVGGNGNTTVNSYDSRTNPHPTTFDTLKTHLNNQTSNPQLDLATSGYGDVGTNGSASLAGNGSIGGNLQVFGSNPQVNSASGGPNTSVDGAIQSIQDSGFGTETAHEVTTPSSPQVIPPAPPAPTNPTPLPGGGNTINLTGNSTMTLTAGNYVVSSISITGRGQLIINSSGGSVNIWVQGNSATGINIAGNGVSNTSGLPSNLGIWYTGSQKVQIAGNGNFVGTIFAPNAQISTQGNGDFYGAAVGQSVTLAGNGAFHFDRALLANSNLFWTPLVNVPEPAQYLQNFQAVSWHEFNPNSPF